MATFALWPAGKKDTLYQASVLFVLVFAYFFMHGCLGFVLFLVLYMFSFIIVSQVFGWEGWVFCTSREIGWEDRFWNDP